MATTFMIAFKVGVGRLGQALRRTPEGYLRFGPTAVSIGPADGLILRQEVGFRDYVMEGHITYGLRAIEYEHAEWIEVVPHHSNRDRYLRSHLRWLFKSADVPVLAEMRDDGSVDTFGPDE